MPPPEDCPPPDPPFDLRCTYPEAMAFIAAALAENIAGMTHKPGLPRGTHPITGRSPLDIGIRTMFDTHVRDQRHRLQVRAWARARSNPKDQDLSFSRACKNNGWTESTATNNVNRALGILYVLMNWPAATIHPVAGA